MVKKQINISLSALLLVFCVLSAQLVSATSPPDMPLPDCILVDGEYEGACLDLGGTDVRVIVQGSFSENSAIRVTTEPNFGICIRNTDQDGWTPSPCYAGVEKPTLGACGVIDLSDDNKFKTMACYDALYTEVPNRNEPLFTVQGVDGNLCGGEGAFGTYVYGGPANVAGARWSEYGPSRQVCEISFDGERPDAMLGPTWISVSGRANIAQPGDGRIPTGLARATTWVKIDGDLGPFIRADFNTDVFGFEVVFENTSVSSDELAAVSFEWDFGDGNTSTGFEPTHTYEQAGQYIVQLVAENQDGSTDTHTVLVDAVGGLLVEVKGPASIDKDNPELFEVKVGNFEDEAIENFQVLLSDSENLLEQVGVPQPSVISRLEKNQVTTSGHQIKGLKTGETVLSARGYGFTASNGEVSSIASMSVAVQPNLTLDLSAPFVEVSGEEVEITLTITNDEQETVSNIRVETLLVLPNEMMDFVSGPLDNFGRNPLVTPVDLAPDETLSVKWTYLTQGRGTVDMQATVAFDSASDQGRAIKVVDGRLAVEVAAFEIADLRLQPKKPIPGEFAFIRGTLKNIGKFDVKDISFKLSTEELDEAIPMVSEIQRFIDDLDPSISPNVDYIATGASHDFIIPIGMVLDVGSASLYSIPLNFTGDVVFEEGDNEQEISVEEILKGDLDRTEYWEDLLTENLALLINGIISIIDEVDDFGDSSLIGGISVGSVEGIIASLQSMGDGLISTGDFIVTNVGDGGESLSNQAEQIKNIIVEYNNTTSFEQKRADLAEVTQNVTIQGVGIFANWMFDIETASESGNYREVAKLLAEPSTTIATGVGTEQAAAQVFRKLLQTSLGRKALFKLNKKFVVPNESSSLSIVGRYIDDLTKSFDDLPEGVLLSGQDALTAGVEGDDLAYMLDEAKLTNTTFFVRPRPANAAKWAKARYNAKPLPIKTKSVNDLDCEWLGYDCNDIGLVVLQEPKDPTDALRQAISDGKYGDVTEYDPGNAEVQAVLKRYSAKKTEFENTQKMLDKLNSNKTHKIVKDPDPANPDADLVEEVEAPGIVVKRYGRDQITTVSIEPGTNRLIFDYNGEPVYSDIDLLSVAKRTGENISASLHKKILKNSSYGFDGQHHATAQTSDFPNATSARNTASQYLAEHSRGGEALLIISPEGITKGYVKSFDLIPEAELEFLDEFKFNNYDLYGQIVKNITYTGVQTK